MEVRKKKKKLSSGALRSLSALPMSVGWISFCNIRVQQWSLLFGGLLHYIGFKVSLWIVGYASGNSPVYRENCDVSADVLLLLFFLLHSQSQESKS